MDTRPLLLLWLLLITLDQSAAVCCDPTKKVCSVSWYFVKAGCTKYCGDGTTEYDADGDQKLSVDEAIALLEALDTDVTNLPADWFTSMDLNGNGFIDAAEFDKDLSFTKKW
uniref:EF-hand domain-containing protein n=1 Tax=Branchiostoma floridae TaxID=7739 RepID=C3Z8C3_BRAFL|eukprot:XP_002595235.1 hypothetical protein BRAFLDRAFT_97184 [Branchiostoma floridae]